MQLARIDGTAIASACYPSMRGVCTVICQPLGADGRDDGPPVLAVDPLGAGMHQHVLFTADGGAVRGVVRDERSPLRNLVVAIVDGPTAAVEAQR
jgi:microcompartment protein CcmK/EutM